MIRQADIAKKLNLSESSVSRILSGRSNHDDQTRSKVLALASQLGYRHLRPTVRKTKKQDKTTPLLEIFVETNSSTPIGLPAVILRLMHGISEGARMENTSIHLNYISSEETCKIHLPDRRSKYFKKSNLAGLLLIGHYPVEVLRELSQQFPCVWICNADQEVAPDSVGQNDLHGTDELIGHLVSLGHRRIGMMSEPANFWPIQSRLGGYVVALAKRSIPYDASIVIHQPTGLGKGDWVPLYEKALREIRKGVTAWICNHDDVGYDFAAYLVSHGVRIPEDVSLCGFDNLPAKPDLPKITSIEWPLEDIGLTAVRRVLRRGKELGVAAVSINFSGKLALGQSTAAARSVTAAGRQKK